MIPEFTHTEFEALPAFPVKHYQVSHIFNGQEKTLETLPAFTPHKAAQLVREKYNVPKEWRLFVKQVEAPAI